MDLWGKIRTQSQSPVPSDDTSQSCRQGWRSSEGHSVSSKTGRREEALSLSSPPPSLHLLPHILILPTPFSLTLDTNKEQSNEKHLNTQTDDKKHIHTYTRMQTTTDLKTQRHHHWCQKPLCRCASRDSNLLGSDLFRSESHISVSSTFTNLIAFASWMLQSDLFGLKLNSWILSTKKWVRILGIWILPFKFKQPEFEFLKLEFFS